MTKKYQHNCESRNCTDQEEMELLFSEEEVESVVEQINKVKTIKNMSTQKNNLNSKTQDTLIMDKYKKSTKIDWNKIKEALKDFPMGNKTGSIVMPASKH